MPMKEEMMAKTIFLEGKAYLHKNIDNFKLSWPHFSVYFFQEKVRIKFPRLSISSPNDYLVLHRFGYKLEDIEGDEELAAALDEYKDRIGEAKINPKWVSFHISSKFLWRAARSCVCVSDVFIL